MTGDGIPLPELPAPARIGDALDQVDTPCLVLDLDAFEHNLRSMQDWADRWDVALRPHAKAHKCPEVALRQAAAGARGICVQKVSEALPFVAAGIRDIHISNEVVGAAKLDLLAALARQARISVCVDHVDNVADLSRAASRHGARIDVLVELDVGQGRCGVSSPTAALELARRIESLPGLRFAGLQAYHGSLQHRRGHAERAAACRETAARAKECARILAEHDYACPIVTGSGTGTAEFDAPGGVYTELQAGTYAFMDGDYGDNEWAGELRLRNSLFLLSTVMSTPSADRIVLDAGLKSTTIECGLPRLYRQPGLSYVAANDEHGVVRVAAGTATPALGSKLLLVPSHCDPTMNLHDTLVALRGGVVEGIWPIAARGLSR
ncbi:alanine racemase [Bordetella bronchialis]|uniref:Alanine racemase n=2 Tax=Bordetella bronchialis TaxID=463025 RepID=A0A193G421_9BORD|nr:alanine racemase [Bordetella bronchialis]ANN74443.1 alanine racemase [Bordetella bronchialis]